MTKTELTALGLEAETIKAIQRIHGQDMQKLTARLQNPTKNDAMRTAIAAMLPMIRQPDNLRKLLTETNYLYYVENRPHRPQEDPPAVVEETPPEVEP